MTQEQLDALLEALNRIDLSLGCIVLALALLLITLWFKRMHDKD